MGYHRAGFDVVGVDIAPQPHYPFEFHQADALAILRSLQFAPLPAGGWMDREWAAIHASPPCQFFTTQSARWRGNGTLADTRVDLLTPTLALLADVEVPWVVENVEGASRVLKDGAPWGVLRLHGGMFGLGVHRPRLFRSSVLLMEPTSPKAPHFVGVYGRTHDGRQLNSRYPGNRVASTLEEAQEAMGMDWADWHGTKEAIPPAYTEFIGEQLIRHLKGIEVRADA